MSAQRPADQSKSNNSFFRATSSTSQTSLLSINDLYNDLLEESINLDQVNLKKRKVALSFMDITKRVEALRYNLALQESELWKLNSEIKETQMRLERIAHRTNELQKAINSDSFAEKDSFFSWVKKLFTASLLLQPTFSIR